jgi:hypothetical protein
MSLQGFPDSAVQWCVQRRPTGAVQQSGGEAARGQAARQSQADRRGWRTSGGMGTLATALVSMGRHGDSSHGTGEHGASWGL